MGNILPGIPHAEWLDLVAVLTGPADDQRSLSYAPKLTPLLPPPVLMSPTKPTLSVLGPAGTASFLGSEGVGKGLEGGQEESGGGQVAAGESSLAAMAATMTISTVCENPMRFQWDSTVCENPGLHGL
jgi:hypothetical protein